MSVCSHKETQVILQQQPINGILRCDRGEPPFHHSFGHGGVLPVFGLDGAILRPGGDGVQETTQGLV